MKDYTDRIVFLGTAGARFVSFGFMRQAGGIWINHMATNIHIDPGPGAFVYAHRKGINPGKVDCVILSHRHLDHCADANHILEAMTLGGRRKRGILFCPEDAIEEDPVVLSFVRENIGETVTIKEGMKYSLSEKLILHFPVKHIHGVETYGVIIQGLKRIAYISDTKYFEGIEKHYNADILIINNTLLERNPEIPHLCAEDSKRIIERIKPSLTILTHFGMSMIKSKPWELAEKIGKETGIKTVAAWDNMVIDINNLTIVKQRGRTF